MVPAERRMPNPADGVVADLTHAEGTEQRSCSPLVVSAGLARGLRAVWPTHRPSTHEVVA